MPATSHSDLRGGLARGQALLQLRNQVGQRHVDEAAAGQHQEVRQPAVQLVDQPPAHDAAQHGHGAGERHLHQRRALVGRALAQHDEVADVVRHLVRQHGQAATRPRRMSAMKAEAIRMPSPKQCTLSPVSTAQPPPPLGVWACA
jgi:hypothetical protein